MQLRMDTFYDSRHFLSFSEDPDIEIRQIINSLPYSTLGIIIDNNVPFQLSQELFPEAVFVERLEGGEKSKNLSAVTRFVGSHQCVLDRNSLIVVIGGGALLDMVGLCCGLMFRGIRYVSVPTTLIAMADAAYGGKTAISFGGKNQIGMYHHPQRVYANPLFLRSLPDDHLASGMVEIAKLGFFFDDIQRALEHASPGGENVADLAILAATRKLQLLERDPFEDDAASVLLYGHPFGNAFETFSYNLHGHHLPHGFAVAAGISFSAWLSEEGNEAAERHIQQFEVLSKWIDLPGVSRQMTPVDSNQMLSLLARDKYVAGDYIRIPALGGRCGYTTIPLKKIAAEYDAWRSWILSGSSEGARRPGDSSARDEESEAYIAGRPSDETVAPLHFSTADGPFLITTSGRQILDWSACLNAPFGHSQRIDTSMLPLNTGNYPTEPRDSLVRRLQEIFPFIGGFQFRSSGTEAVEAALRYLLAALGPSLQTVSVEGCYHGLTLGARSIMGSEEAGLCHTILPFALLLQPQELTLQLETLLQSGPVAMWLEAVQGATLRSLPASFLEALRKLRDRFPQRFVVVCDDMLASIRCGNWCSMPGTFHPDLVIAGKSWANGYPFSFFGVAPWVRGTAGDILGTTSYGGNPVACANAVYSIGRIEETNLLEHIRRSEAKYSAVLKGAVSMKPSVLRSEWHGLLFGFEMVDARAAQLTARSAANAGLLVSQLGTVIRCTPQLDLPEDLLEWGLDLLMQAVDANA